MTATPATTSAPAPPADTVLTPSFVAVLIGRVQWLVRLRWAYVAALVLAGLYVDRQAWWIREGSLAHAPWAAAGLMASYNAVVWAGLRFCRRRHTEQNAAFIRVITDFQIVLDSGCFLWLAFAGFMPMLFLMIPHMAIAASLLPKLDAYVQAAGAAAGSIFWAFGYTGRELLRAGGPQEVRMLTAQTPQDGLGALQAGLAAFILPAMLFLTVWFTKAILTRLRNINRRLTLANQELAELDRTKSRFLRLSSHQLRGNVAAIHSMLGAMQAVAPLADRQAELAQRIRTRASELVEQMDEMLLLSTIRENGVEIQARSPQDLCSALTREAEALAGEVEARGLTLTVQGTSQPLYVQAWPEALGLVARNLLTNAVKYTPGPGRVSAAVRRRGERVEVEVSDTGIGIPDAQREQVFHEFYRGPKARQMASGTGLGLPILRAILDKLGGQLRLAAGEGTGTIVTIELPLAAAPVAPAAAPAQTRLAPDPVDPAVCTEKAPKTMSNIGTRKD